MALYQALALNDLSNDIRLLRILPRAADTRESDPVQCALRVCELNENTDFKAMSYAWGDETDQRAIGVNGHIIKVTANLECALRHLRVSKDHEDIWIDALCINQSDNAEKSHQVAQMHRIFSTADQTVVWLGAAADESELAMAVLKTLGSEALDLGVHEVTSNSPVWHTVMAGDVQRLQLGAGQGPAIHAMVERIGYAFPSKAVHAVYQRPYWTRLWVLQEFALAKRLTVHCGHDTVFGDELYAAIQFYQMLSLFLISRSTQEDDLSSITGVDTNRPSIGDAIPISRREDLLKYGPPDLLIDFFYLRRQHHSWKRIDARNRPPTDQLLAVLERIWIVGGGTYQERQTKIAKDRIYGLLGLVDHLDELDLRVDYSISDEELLADVADLLLSAGHISLLRYGSIHDDLALPSWTPDWREEIIRPFVWKAIFKPAGSLPTTPILKRTSNLLQLSCLVVDHIDTIGTGFDITNWTDDSEHFKILTILREVEVMLQRTKPPSCLKMDENKWQEGCWRIPIADQHVSSLMDHGRASNDAFLAWQNLCLRSDVDANDGAKRSREEEAFTAPVSWYRSAMRDMYGNRLIQGSTGLVGVGPGDVQCNDVVVIIPGLDSLLVLRKAGAPFEEHHRIVGVAYMYGIMDGELIEPDTVLETITLC